MFQLTVVEHVRLDFGHVAHNYTLHAEAAERLADVVMKVRITLLVLLGIAAAAAITSVLQPGRNYAVSAAVAAGLALIGFNKCTPPTSSRSRSISASSWTCGSREAIGA